MTWPTRVPVSDWLHGPRHSRLRHSISSTELRRLLEGMIEHTDGWRRVTISFGSETMGNWRELRTCVQDHGSVIRQTWYRMTPEERKLMLKSLIGTIPENHRPEFANIDGFIAHAFANPSLAFPSLNNESMTTPYTNLVDFCETPERMLMFMQSRANSNPAAAANSALVCCPNWLVPDGVLFAKMSGWTATFTHKGDCSDSYATMIPWVNF